MHGPERDASRKRMLKAMIDWHGAEHSDDGVGLATLDTGTRDFKMNTFKMGAMGASGGRAVGKYKGHVLKTPGRPPVYASYVSSPNRRKPEFKGTYNTKRRALEVANNHANERNRKMSDVGNWAAYNEYKMGAYPVEYDQYKLGLSIMGAGMRKRSGGKKGFYLPGGGRKFQGDWLPGGGWVVNEHGQMRRRGPFVDGDYNAFKMGTGVNARDPFKMGAGVNAQNPFKMGAATPWWHPGGGWYDNRANYRPGGGAYLAPSGRWRHTTAPGYGSVPMYGDTDTFAWGEDDVGAHRRSFLRRARRGVRPKKMVNWMVKRMKQRRAAAQLQQGAARGNAKCIATLRKLKRLMAQGNKLARLALRDCAQAQAISSKARVSGPHGGQAYANTSVLNTGAQVMAHLSGV